MHDTYYLVAIMDNNYIEANLFEIFWDVMKRIANNNSVSISKNEQSNNNKA